MKLHQDFLYGSLLRQRHGEKDRNIDTKHSFLMQFKLGLDLEF